MSTPPTEPKSVSQILKQRQQSRSAAIAPKAGGSKGPPGPGGAPVNENLNPVLPPLYPTAPKSIPLIPEVAHTVKVYNKLAQYFRSNFSVAQEAKGVTDGFYLDRYTDQYKSPLSLKPHLLHNLPDSKYPEELTKKTAVTNKPAFSRRKRRRIEDISDEEAEGKESSSPKKPPETAPEEDDDEEKEETSNVDDLDELEEEMDEEMDVGTDYAQSYFDNGEGDEDDRDEDDGPTY